MWLGLACASALFAGVTAILAKIGVKNTDSTLATAIRTAVVLAFSWLLVFITGAQAVEKSYPTFWHDLRALGKPVKEAP